ncbi:MAG: hypothetical protein IJ308_09025, partial [Clostridia bacterium]|nr:hypothetical protein [Clostridia bacterium]
EKRYEAGETVIIKTAIVTDVSVEAFVNGESIGTQTAVKTGDEYTHWEFTFVMPECDVTLTFVISDGFDVLPTEVKTITDIERYADMKQEADKIEVEFDNNTGVPVLFTIEDQNEIQEIMQLIFDAELVDRGKEMYDGDNTNIAIIQGDKEYRMSVRMNKENDRYYAFATDDLQVKIRTLASQIPNPQ